MDFFDDEAIDELEAQLRETVAEQGHPYVTVKHIDFRGYGPPTVGRALAQLAERHEGIEKWTNQAPNKWMVVFEDEEPPTA